MDTSTSSPINKEKIQSISKLFKVISDPTRLSILFLLQKKELSVGNIVLALDMEQSAISHQLKILKDSRLVKARREGKSMVYSLDDLHVFSILEQVLTHINEQEQYKLIRYKTKWRFLKFQSQRNKKITRTKINRIRILKLLFSPTLFFP